MKKHTKVNCEVENCKHNDSKKCDLDELDISCTCDDDECLDKEETICNNFEKDDSDEEILEIEEIDDNTKYAEEYDDMDEKYYEETMIEESSDLDELED